MENTFEKVSFQPTDPCARSQLLSFLPSLAPFPFCLFHRCCSCHVLGFFQGASRRIARQAQVQGRGGEERNVPGKRPGGALVLVHLQWGLLNCLLSCMFSFVCSTIRWWWWWCGPVISFAFLWVLPCSLLVHHMSHSCERNESLV